MLNEELLKELEQKISSGELGKSEVLTRLKDVLDVEEVQKKPRFFSVTRVFYAFGAALVLVGVLFLVGLVWSDLGAVGRVVMTLGAGLLFAIAGSVLLIQKPEHLVGSIFHAIGGVLIPIGGVVLVNELGAFLSSSWLYAQAFGVIAVFYLALHMVHRKNILTFFAIANFTAFLYLFSWAMLKGIKTPPAYFYNYLTMVVGLVYMYAAYEFRKIFHRYLFRLLCFFGAFGFLMAGFVRAQENDLWFVIYFLFLGVGMAASYFLKSSMVMFLSMLFFVFHLIYITSEFFVDSIGWPVSLVVLGIIIIILGYFSIELNRKILKKPLEDATV